MDSEARWAVGYATIQNNYREKLIKESPLIGIGDIVVSIKFYSNGRPVPFHKFDYLSQITGIVVSEEYSERFKEDVIIVIWKGDSTTRTNYIKKNAAAYLIKLS